MSTTRKRQSLPDERFLQEALRHGRAVLCKDQSLKAIGKPDVALQARVVHLDMEHCRRLESAAVEMGDLAPIILFRDSGTNKVYLADGHHRHHVYMNMLTPKRVTIPAYVIDSDAAHQEALEYATMCNREMCLGRRKEDIRKAVRMLVASEKWASASYYKIAEHVGTSPASAKKYMVEFFTERGERPQSSYGPKPTANGSGFVGSVGGKTKWLGSDPDKAAEKLKAFREESQAFPRGFVLPGSANLERVADFIKWLLTRGIVCKTKGNAPASGLGQVILHGNTILICADRIDRSNISELFGRAKLNHRDVPGNARIILVFHHIGACKAIDIAREMGVELMTPEELVESLKS